MPISSFASRTHTTHPPNYSRPIPTDPMDRHDISALDLPRKNFGGLLGLLSCRPSVDPPRGRFAPPDASRTRQLPASAGRGKCCMPGPVACAEGCCLPGHDRAVQHDTGPTAAAVLEEVAGPARSHSDRGAERSVRARRLLSSALRYRSGCLRVRVDVDASRATLAGEAAHSWPL